MTKEEVVNILNNNNFKCELIDNTPMVYVKEYNPNTYINIKRLIPEYKGSIGYRPLKNTDEQNI